MARKRKGDPIHGWLNLDKPRDITSTQCVGRLKRLFNAQKVGHGGTLDPLADGILPIAFGEATKTVQWMMDADKEYVFTLHWGTSTASHDAEGEVTATSEARPSRADIEDWLADYTGDIDQVPPKFSAIKIDGERAYDLAREGDEFEIPSRTVHVFETGLIEMPDADHTTIHVRSGKGFYVRAMARDLAFDLGCAGHITKLRRTRVGIFDEAQALTFEELEVIEDKDALIAKLAPLQTVLDDLPVIDVSAEDATDIKLGRQIMLMPHVAEDWRAQQVGEDRTTLAECDGVAIALGEVRAGRFQPNKVFQV